MQLCSNCGHQNRAGVVFCENCGASLIGKMPLDTKSLEGSSEEEKAQIGIDASVLIDVKVQGAATFQEGDTLRLDIEGSPEPIKLKPKAETIFGRRDPATGAMPDVDLTPFAGYRMGVSRRHAAIRVGDDNGLDVWDLGSSNGTFLNGLRLSAHRPYRLHDSDELRLGQMMVRVYFDATPKAAPSPAAAEAAEPPKVSEAAAVQPPKAAEPITSPIPQPAGPTPAAAPPAGESPAPVPPVAQGAKVESGSTVAVQPSEVKAADPVPVLTTLVQKKEDPLPAPLVSPGQPKPEQASTPAKPEEASPSDAPKAQDNQEKRD